MVHISEISYKNRKNCTYLYDFDHEKTTITTGYLKKLSMACKSWRYEVFETDPEEISQEEILKCLLFCFSASARTSVAKVHL